MLRAGGTILAAAHHGCRAISEVPPISGRASKHLRAVELDATAIPARAAGRRADGGHAGRGAGAGTRPGAGVDVARMSDCRSSRSDGRRPAAR